MRFGRVLCLFIASVVLALLSRMLGFSQLVVLFGLCALLGAILLPIAFMVDVAEIDEFEREGGR